jgi:hypothetical protein
MADKVVLEAEIKSNIKAVSKETKDLTNEFGAFGITIGGIKDKFKDMGKIMMNGLKQVSLQAKLAGVGFKKMFSGQIIGGAKTLFTVIKTGIAATGIGLLVVAFGSLVAHVTNTKKGAEALEKTFQTLGAAVSVITDRIAKFGGAVIKFFKGDFKGAAEDAKASVTGIVKEINEEVTATVKMVDANQKLRDAQRALNVETAQSVADIEKLKLIAEDITKSYKEREEAATQAFEKETDLENKRIKLAEEAVALEVERHRMLGKDGVMAEDLDALAELEINLANVRQESAGRQISLQNFLNGLREQEKAEKEATLQAEQDADDAMWEKKIADNNKFNEDKLAADKKAADAEIALAEEVAAKKKAVQQEMLGNLISTLNSNLEAQGNRIESEYNKEIKLAEANGKDTEAIEEKYEGKRTALAEKQKKLKIGLAKIDMFQSVIAAYNQGMGVPPPAGLVLGPVSAGLALAAGMANINSIMQTDVGGGGGGGGVPGGAIGGGAPAPQMMSGAFDLTGGVEPEAMRAYVVTDEMTSSQNQLANIRRRATI